MVVFIRGMVVGESGRSTGVLLYCIIIYLLWRLNPRGPELGSATKQNH